MGRKKRPSKSKEAEISNFTEVMLKEGFTVETVEICIENGFCDKDSLYLLNSDKQAVKELALPLAQRLRLEQFIMKSKPTDVPQTECLGAVGGPAKDTTLADLMAELSVGQDLHETHQLKAPAQGALQEAQDPILQAGVPPQGIPADPHVYLRNHPGLGEFERPYDIVDYINLVPPLTEDRVINDKNGNGTQLVMRTEARKPRLENVSVEEWCLANVRIMNLIVTNAGFNPSLIKDYMSYTIKTCELFKKYQTVSVLQYDREYRYMQSVYRFRWGSDMPHLFNVHLVRKSHPGSENYRPLNVPGSARGSKGLFPSNDMEVCRLFNNRSGCRFGSQCKFVHRCIVPGCSKGQPRYTHHSDPLKVTPIPADPAGNSAQ